MVTRDRGQLILVGAIAIALILLGLVLIINTALFTQVVGSEGTVESAKEGGVSGQEIGNAIGTLVAEENRNPGTPAVSTSDEHVLEHAIANRSIEGSGAFVSLSYLRSNHTGSIVQQRTVRNFTDNDGSTSSWYPVNSTKRGEVGEFVITVRTDRGTGGNLNVVFDNGTASRTVAIDVDTSNDEVTIDTPTTRCDDVQSTNGTVRIDLDSGVAYENGTCQFRGIGEDQYSVEFSGNLGEIEGTYDLVVDSTVAVDQRYSDADGPNRRDAIWSFEYRFTHDSKDVTVRSDPREVEVYD